MTWSIASLASTYNFIVANPPGSSSDLVARTVAQEYNRVTGKTLVLNYAPGADQIIAVTKFVNQKELTVILGGTTMHVFNVVNKENLPYTENSFFHVGWIGWDTTVWYTRSQSLLTSLEDMLSKLDQGQHITVGVDAQSTQVNVTSLKKFRKNTHNLKMITYKGSPQTLADVLGGHVDAGVSSLSPTLVEQHAAGKIRILGVTRPQSIVISGTTVPSAEQILRVPQFSGGFSLSISAQHADTAEGIQLTADLHKVINSDFVRQKLLTIQIQVDGSDSQKTNSIIKQYRQTVKTLQN
jgi:tripartite-type tricarboxylate transporter receptor subunit TctC